MKKTNSKISNKTPLSSSKKEDFTHATARKVFQKIKSLNLEPIPHIYELWFRYFQGYPEIVHAIDNHPKKMDEETCYKFHELYLSETAKNDAIKIISDKVQSSITEMVGVMDSAKSVTSEYGEILGKATKKIETVETIEDLGLIVSSIVEDTKIMVQKNHDLEFQLTNSSTQVAELRKNLDIVKKEAMTDGLTGLANRKAFDKQIHDWVEETGTSGGDLCLMMLDIDHFKQFNDTYGHQTGDQVLRLVARTLTDGVKGRDMAARFGGEEFAIILPDTPLSGAVMVAEVLRKSVESKEIINKTSNENLGQITFSAGVAQYIKGESITDFIGRSDTALYKAKNSGRNQIKTA